MTFLRRCSKQDLSACVVDAAEDTERHFSVDNLRQLFKFNETTVCDTHDTFKCKRCRDGKQLVKAPALLYGDTSRSVEVYQQIRCSSPADVSVVLSWNHYPNAELGKLHDDVLRAELGQGDVSFVFQYVYQAAMHGTNVFLLTTFSVVQVHLALDNLSSSLS